MIDSATTSTYCPIHSQTPCACAWLGFCNGCGEKLDACTCTGNEKWRNEQGVERCQAYILVKMPYDSYPDVAHVQCGLDEDHDDEHSFEYIEGGRSDGEVLWPRKVA